MKTRVWFCIVGIILLGALGVWQVLTGDTLFHQRRNMAVAKEFVPVVRQKLDSFAEFKHLRVAEYTAAGGSLLVSGPVADFPAIEGVREIVAKTSPPVEVVYHLFPTNDPR